MAPWRREAVATDAIIFDCCYRRGLLPRL